jgi:hypothetical protein
VVFVEVKIDAFKMREPISKKKPKSKNEKNWSMIDLDLILNWESHMRVLEAQVT